MAIPSFSIFKKEVFSKLSNKEKNVLFFWSLFDPSSWEEGKEPEFAPSFKRGTRRVLKILKEKSPKFRRVIKRDKKFDRRFLWTEFLTNYLLTAQLQEDIEEKKLQGLLYKNLRKTIFPDLMLKKGSEKIPIEIKGLVACSSLKNRVKDEVIENIKKNNKGNGKKYKHFFLLFLFPLCLSDDYFRINQLVEGYYVYEDFVNFHAKISCNVLCQCVSEKYDEQYCINRLSERLLKGIYGI
ncbi:MAG: hypothetical protein PHW73_03925 [Atribacterota bacterium]|nr:hypothetical protein [Atribacterota bacterium]